MITGPVTQSSPSLLRLAAGVATGVATLRLVQRALRSPDAERLFMSVAELLDWAIGWHRLPLPLGLAVLIAARKRLRQANLHDTTAPRPAASTDPPGRRLRATRSPARPTARTTT